MCSHHTSQARLLLHMLLGSCQWNTMYQLLLLLLCTCWLFAIWVINVVVVINTDLTITTEKLVELFATMDDCGLLPVPLSWELDYQLGLPHSKVAEMERNLRGPSQRREAYLDLYATGHPCPSWRRVAKVLRGVELPHHAARVESTYVQGTRIIPMHTLWQSWEL